MVHPCGGRATLLQRRLGTVELGTWLHAEFVGEEPTRQVERYGDRWFSSRKKHHPELGRGLAEGPFSAMNYERESEVTAEEFEKARCTAGLHEA